MSEPIFYIGTILCLIWFGATLIVKKQKRKPLMIIGGVVSIILLVYTLQWKLYMIGLFGGLFCGSIGIGYRQDKLKEVHKEMGIVQTMVIWAIFFALMFMVIAVACPDFKF